MMNTAVDLIACNEMSQCLYGKTYDIKSHTIFFEYIDLEKSGLNYSDWIGKEHMEILDMIEQSGWHWAKDGEDYILVDKLDAKPWDDLVRAIPLFNICEMCEKKPSQFRLGLHMKGVKAPKLSGAKHNGKWYVFAAQKKDLQNYLCS